MFEIMGSSLAAFLPALLVAVVGTPLARVLALRFNVMDEPGPRKLHVTSKPLLGGLAIYFGVIIGLLISASSEYRSQLVALVIGSTFIAVVGLLDDRISLHPKLKLFFAIPLAGLILVMGGIRITVWPLSPFLKENAAIALVLSVGLTILWVVVVTSAFAILDHMDGLCGGVATIASAFFLLFALLERQYLMAVLAAALIGANLGFLRCNFRRASIFMGDSGALLVGFLIAALGILLKFTQLTTYTSWMVPVLVLGVPLFDLGLVVISRFRRGLPPSTSPGKDHFSHRLVSLGFGETGAVVVVYIAAILFGGLAVLVTRATVFGAYLLFGVVSGCLAVSIWKLEQAPYEKQEGSPWNEKASPQS